MCSKKKRDPASFALIFLPYPDLGYRDTQMGDKVGNVKKTRSLETFFALAKNKL